MRFDYVTVGHVTVDVLPSLDSPDEATDGARQPGGGAFYSALQAARLGLRTAIVTRGVAHELEALLEPYRGELEVLIAPATATTTLLTHGAGHARCQRVLAWAGPVAVPEDLETAILHVAPVARETPRDWSASAEFVGLTPQGLVRDWDEDGELRHVMLDGALLPARWDAAVLSATELERCAQLLPSARDGVAAVTAGAKPTARDRIVAVTAGAQPTAIHTPGGAERHVPTYAVPARHDDLGAGDVFAAAFFVALHEGRPPAAAGALGNAAAAVRLAGAGPGAIGDRAAIRLR